MIKAHARTPQQRREKPTCGLETPSTDQFWHPRAKPEPDGQKYPRKDSRNSLVPTPNSAHYTLAAPGSTIRRPPLYGGSLKNDMGCTCAKISTCSPYIRNLNSSDTMWHDFPFQWSTSRPVHYPRIHLTSNRIATKWITIRNSCFAAD